MYEDLNWVLDAASNNPKGEVITRRAREVLGSGLTYADMAQLNKALGPRRVVDLVLLPSEPVDSVARVLPPPDDPVGPAMEEESTDCWIVGHTIRMLKDVEKTWDRPNRVLAESEFTAWKVYLAEQRDAFVTWHRKLEREWPVAVDRLDRMHPGFVLVLDSIHSFAAAEMARGSITSTRSQASTGRSSRIFRSRRKPKSTASGVGHVPPGGVRPQSRQP